MRSALEVWIVQISFHFIASVFCFLALISLRDDQEVKQGEKAYYLLAEFF